VIALIAVSLFSAEQRDVREGNALYAEGKFEEALQAYERAEKEKPAPEISLDRGDALHKLGRHDEAAEAFAKALNSADPAFQAKAYYNLGTTKARGGDREGAIEALTRALELDPEDRDAKWNLELLLRKPPEQKGGDKGGDKEEKKDEKKDEKQEEKKEQGKEDEKQEEQQEKSEEQKEQKPEEKEQKQQQAAPKDLDKQDAERVLDAMKANEKNLQMWRFQMKEQRREGAEKDW
jgi:tetratricopeptide (TPR) repeat protein